MNKPNETIIRRAGCFASGSDATEDVESGRKYLRYLLIQQSINRPYRRPTHCQQETWLKFNAQGVNRGKFSWSCANFFNCKTEYPYIPPTDRFNFARDDFMPILKSFETIPQRKREEIEIEIKVQMIEILKHYIECDWGAHYNTIFQRIIKVYLEDPFVLDYVLRSDVIRNVGIVGKTGAKIFPTLMFYLQQVNSSNIQNYLEVEFEYYNNALIGSPIILIS